MLTRLYGFFGATALLTLVHCGGDSRDFLVDNSETQDASGGSDAHADAGNATDAKVPDAIVTEGSSDAAHAEAAGGNDATATTDSATPDADASSDTGTPPDAAPPVDAGPDIVVPKSCVGPPSCAVAQTQQTCEHITGCSFSQCTQKNPGVMNSCGSDAKDGAGNCAPGCHLAANGNCVGANNDYYGSEDECGTRQSQDACIGVGGLWSSCTWLSAVKCTGRPTRPDCSNITDSIVCATEGCSWQ